MAPVAKAPPARIPAAAPVAGRRPIPLRAVPLRSGLRHAGQPSRDLCLRRRFHGSRTGRGGAGLVAAVSSADVALSAPDGSRPSSGFSWWGSQRLHSPF
eukprot:evm.model.scf_1016.3 EVM.evm.TU.scf_1016.3   scf_1016:11596-13914(-)